MVADLKQGRKTKKTPKARTGPNLVFPLQEEADYKAIVETTRGAWTEAFKSLSAARWATGDAAIDIDTRWGERRLQSFANAIEKGYGTVLEYRRIASRYPSSTRVEEVDWQVYRVFASVADEEARFGLIREAAENEWKEKHAKRIKLSLGGLLDSRPKTGARSQEVLFDEELGADMREYEVASDERQWLTFMVAFEKAKDLPWSTIAENPRFSWIENRLKYPIVNRLREIEEWAYEISNLLKNSPARLNDIPASPGGSWDDEEEEEEDIDVALEEI